MSLSPFTEISCRRYFARSKSPFYSNETVKSAVPSPSEAGSYFTPQSPPSPAYDDSLEYADKQQHPQQQPSAAAGTAASGAHRGNAGPPARPSSAEATSAIFKAQELGTPTNAHANTPQVQQGMPEEFTTPSPHLAAFSHNIARDGTVSGDHEAMHGTHAPPQPAASDGNRRKRERVRARAEGMAQQ